MAALSVSVIVPSYNRAALLPRAIGSALETIEPGDEVIVVDDGSTDETETTVKEFGDRVGYLPLLHGGAGRARNAGVAAARGSLVAFLDSDDEWTPDKLQLQRALMAEQPEVLFCFSDFATRRPGRAQHHHGLAGWSDDRRGWDEILGPGVPYSTIAALPSGREDFAVHVGDLYPALVRHDLIPTFTLLVRREAAGNALQFAEDLPTYEDKECHVRLARAGLAAYLDCETAWQWGHSGRRLSKVDHGAQAMARLAIIERTYRPDAALMETHSDWIEAAAVRERLVRARWHIRHGRTSEARDDLRHAGSAPLGYRVLARLPPWRPRWLGGVRRLLRRGGEGGPD